MDNGIFLATPAGSLINVNDNDRLEYIRGLRKLPPTLRTIATSLKTGSYIRGLRKTFNLSSLQEEHTSFLVLQVLLGEKRLADIPGHLSSVLRIPNDKAQKIAQEIERDLFAPIALELNQYLANKKKSTGSIAEKLNQSMKLNPALKSSAVPPSRFPRKPAAPSNILNLKDQRPGPIPPPIPH